MRYVLTTPPNPQPLPPDDQGEGEFALTAILFYMERGAFGGWHGMPCPYRSDMWLFDSGDSRIHPAYFTERGDESPRMVARR